MWFSQFCRQEMWALAEMEPPSLRKTYIKVFYQGNSIQVPRETPQASRSTREHNAFWPLDGGHLYEKEKGRVEDEGREREGGKVEAGQSCRLLSLANPRRRCHHRAPELEGRWGETGQETEGGRLRSVPLGVCLLARTYL